jgi:hypothetical protein
MVRVPLAPGPGAHHSSNLWWGRCRNMVIVLKVNPIPILFGYLGSWLVVPLCAHAQSRISTERGGLRTLEYWWKRFLYDYEIVHNYLD